MLDQSKTRSFQIVSQNPQGSQLCLQNLFVNVYQQLVHFFVLEISTRRVVYFLDEGSLRDEKKMVLKVLHSYLDEYKVVFVAVVNKPFDVANVNRMICIYRSLLSKDNKKILKYACLGLQIDHEHQTTENDFNNIIFELCQDYRRILTNSNILHILHNRDFSVDNNDLLSSENLEQ
ncbi:unnamed protein product [Rotaria sp. Silwood2]|nr:unnamed protein product [Rotaria sp. Silwood2]